MLSGGKPAAAIISRKGVCRLFQLGTLRPCLSLPSPVSTTIRREGVSTTSEWIDIFRRPSSVAKRGISHGSFWISSWVAEGRMKRVWPTVSSSTILVMVTLPIFQRIRRSPCPSTGAPTPAWRYRCRLSILQRPRKGAAVEQDVLSGDEARLGAAQEGAGEPELLRLAEAPCRIELRPYSQH